MEENNFDYPDFYFEADDEPTFHQLQTMTSGDDPMIGNYDFPEFQNLQIGVQSPTIPSNSPGNVFMNENFDFPGSQTEGLMDYNGYPNHGNLRYIVQLHDGSFEEVVGTSNMPEVGSIYSEYSNPASFISPNSQPSLPSIECSSPSSNGSWESQPSLPQTPSLSSSPRTRQNRGKRSKKLIPDGIIVLPAVETVSGRVGRPKMIISNEGKKERKNLVARNSRIRTSEIEKDKEQFIVDQIKNLKKDNSDLVSKLTKLQHDVCHHCTLFRPPIPQNCC
uniref:BZIP domain-containing protein n=1 Tax=Panagrolaimus sp. JU765 TaxID=591449 RepID=A0AC34RGV6_9BILA